MDIKSNKLVKQIIVCVLDTLIPPNLSRPSLSLYSFHHKCCEIHIFPIPVMIKAIPIPVMIKAIANRS